MTDTEVRKMNGTLKAESNGMSLAALIFGILSLLFSAAVLPTFLFGPMALTLGLLSRGEKKLGSQASIAVILAVISAVISLVVTVVAVIVAVRFFSDSSIEIFRYIERTF